MNKNIKTNLIKIYENFKKQQEQYLIDIDFIEKSINEDSEFGRLSLYLFTTDRRSSSIINKGYDKYDASDFSCILHDIHHALYDDGEITFYLINDEPRFSCIYDFELKDDIEYDDDTIKSKCKILKNITIDNWIKLSEEYFVNEIKSNFLIDYQINPELIKHYKKYDFFDENWIKEIPEWK